MGGSVGGGTNSGAASAEGGESEETGGDAMAGISREKAAEHISPSPTSKGGDGGTIVGSAVWRLAVFYFVEKSFSIFLENSRFLKTFSCFLNFFLFSIFLKNIEFFSRKRV